MIDSSLSRRCALLLLVTASSACGSSEAPASASGFDVDAATDSSAGADASTTDTSSDASSAEDAAKLDGGPVLVDGGAPLSPGLYASKQTFASLLKNPLGGGESPSETLSLLLHTITAEGGQLVSKNQVCEIRQPPSFGVNVVFPRALIDAMPTTSSVVSAGAGGTVEFSRDVLVLGATLTKPETEALPTKRDDPRVVDADKDGQPGGTVKITGLISGDIYIVQRNLGGLRGAVGAGGKVTGTLLGTNEQVTLGASNATLASINLQPRKDPDPAKSRFVLVPVAAGTTCGKIVADEKTLFP